MKHFEEFEQPVNEGTKPLAENLVLWICSQFDGETIDINSKDFRDDLTLTISNWFNKNSIK